ncbi:MAG: hypothetical protein HPY66_3157 [Firmicutes bacterium]|nr:hypothetical protein [Bacillota bacterium]
MITKEIHKGSTPNGGVRSEIYYLNKEHQPVAKEKAELAIVRELDEDGNLVFETISSIKK